MNSLTINLSRRVIRTCYTGKDGDLWIRTIYGTWTLWERTEGVDREWVKLRTDLKLVGGDLENTNSVRNTKTIIHLTISY